MKSLFCLLLLWGTACFAQSKNLSETYETDAFTVNYPKGWRVNTESAFHVLVLYPPSIGDSFETSINFFIMDEGEATANIDTYARREKGFMEIRTDVQRYQILESRNGKCVRFDYTMNLSGMRLTGIQYRFIKGPTVYSLSFSGEEKSFQFYKEVAEEVMMSFRFK
ncbi:MAG TPA: hypothetical protein VK183_10635 [Flavobacterium sp.]|nr:hypothetical protein [Flavobacterium sp.]